MLVEDLLILKGVKNVSTKKKKKKKWFRGSDSSIFVFNIMKMSMLPYVVFLRVNAVIRYVKIPRFKSLFLILLYNVLICFDIGHKDFSIQASFIMR